jgi:DNA-binding LacI/PurR family transcriptional regulator
VVLLLRGISSRGTSVVVSDYQEHARWATMHLAEHGYQSIGMIALSPGSRGKSDVMSQQIEGWRLACRKLGRDEGAAPLVVAHHEPEHAVDTVESAIKETSVRAVLVATAGQTEATYAAARRLGLRIPDDLAVIAMQQVDSILYDPRPAHWSLDLKTMCRLAIEEAVLPMAAPPTRHVVDATFITGPSCGCPE